MKFDAKTIGIVAVALLAGFAVKSYMTNKPTA